MSKRWLAWLAVWAVVTTLLFVLINWILVLFISIVGLTAVIIGAMASDWDRHSTFEEREQLRARRRQEKFERGADARARDRALWEAHHAQRESGGS